MHYLFTLLTLIVIFPSQAMSEQTVKGKWYTVAQLELGKQVFEKNCMACHGEKGQGLAADWKKPQADGHYPPPPLNGTAHTWHHPFSTLLDTINKGGVPLGGKMPAFNTQLSNTEKVAVIARFQDWWPKEIYQGWVERGGLSN